MPIFALDKQIVFPPVEESEPDGLLAIGGDLSVERLLTAYRQGIFPWYEGEYPLWWCPDPRFVLFPGKLKISKSMEALFKKEAFTFTINKAFDQVIRHCKSISRKGQNGTWITNEVELAYNQLHELGYAHSAEVWSDGELVGGLYGIRMGKVFFGESMFSKMSNASKYAFISYVEELKKEGVQLIDCQVHTSHLESLGAEMIPRKRFTHLLKELI
ncbi:leucyl/phenylalanyl-tRNA--protein transferase [Pinibacter soli]|uniref:Leucyl/phenylalanyl-tRNA--protein transferase n=1 Tax=Pinibacter soli TaxID=3044211 RepID=A0ABT6RCH9_9BACT|nr:leucyl/phenylalanyl-tRNA--protein transferase [Pinibacter soli]MDI3319577.1 leucyl/phenylalanyl-tRNA--protein transferase [Pinibacter soli]